MNETREVFHSEVLPRMALESSDRILELGCGDGWACRAVAAVATQGMVVGIDSSGNAIRAARRESLDFDNILYIEAAAEENPWQDNFFSQVLLIDSFDMLRDPGAALRHVHRVLAPDGRVWIVGAATDRARELLTASGFAVETSGQELVCARK